MTGPVTRALLKVRDDRLRRCWWCGAWAYHHDPCATCHAADRREAVAS